MLETVGKSSIPALDTSVDRSKLFLAWKRYNMSFTSPLLGAYFSDS